VRNRDSSTAGCFMTQSAFHYEVTCSCITSGRNATGYRLARRERMFVYNSPTTPTV